MMDKQRWTPELRARLKGLRDHQDGSDYAWRGYGDELAEADPISRIEELERRWEALKTWLGTTDVPVGIKEDGAFDAYVTALNNASHTMRGLEASRD